MEILESVVSEGTGSKAQVAGYAIGGKTGTANKVIDGRYGEGKYVASFIGIAPTTDPRITVLVVIDEPNPNNTYGGQIAAPVAGKVMEDTLKYLNIPVDYEEEVEKKKMVVVPEVRNMTRDEAAEILATNKLGYTSTSIDGSDIIINQSPLPGIEVEENTKIHLTVQGELEGDQDQEGKVLVPNVLDKTIQEANKILKEKGLNIEINGSGISIDQQPQPGEYINKGAFVRVEFKPIE